jgi:hypothetical protein
MLPSAYRASRRSWRRPPCAEAISRTIAFVPERPDRATAPATIGIPCRGGSPWPRAIALGRRRMPSCGERRDRGEISGEPGSKRSSCLLEPDASLAIGAIYPTMALIRASGGVARRIGDGWVTRVAGVRRALGHLSDRRRTASAVEPRYARDHEGRTATVPTVASRNSRDARLSVVFARGWEPTRPWGLDASGRRRGGRSPAR